MTTVDDDALLRTMFYLWERLKLVVEPTGALGAAAALHGPPGRRRPRRRHPERRQRRYRQSSLDRPRQSASIKIAARHQSQRELAIGLRVGEPVAPLRRDPRLWLAHRRDAALGTTMICAGVRHGAVRRRQSDPRRAVSGQPRRHLAAGDGRSSTSVVSIVLVVLSVQGSARGSRPRPSCPLLFVVSAVLLLVEWWLTVARADARRRGRLSADLRHRPAARLGLLADRHRAVRSAHREEALRPDRRRGTLGGLLGGLLAERVAAVSTSTAMLPMLAALNLFCAWQIRRLAAPVAADAVEPSRRSNRRPELSRRCAASGLRVLRAGAVPAQPRRAGAARHDRRRAGRLPLQGAGGRDLRPRRQPAALLRGLLRRHQPDHVRRSRPRRAGSRSKSSAWPRRPARRRWRCWSAASARLFAPGPRRAPLVARGGESVFRGSLFRSGYELFYTPIPVGGKARRQVDHRRRLRSPGRRGRRRHHPLVLLLSRRAASTRRFSSIADRLLGRGPARRQPAQSRLHPDARAQPAEPRRRARPLRRRRPDHPHGDAAHAACSTRRPDAHRPAAHVASRRRRPANDHRRLGRGRPEPAALDPELQEILALRSRDAERVLRVLRDRRGHAGRRWCRTSSRCWPGIRWPTTRSTRCARSPKSGSAS